jgi:hypothetical protein
MSNRNDITKGRKARASTVKFDCPASTAAALALRD